jgi:hypothetical protein
MKKQGYKDYYKEPNEDFKYDENNMHEYWYWIHERLEIWYKRVVLKQPAPWTEDELLKKFKFTNAIRDLDRLTIYYINNLLCNLKDTKESKMELLLNTMIYRLFCKTETWELFGYLHLANWDEEWGKAKEALRALKASGKPVFTDAYYVNDLRVANPDPVTCHNKTENAICLIEIWHSRIEEIYTKSCVEADGMKEQLKFFTTLPAVGPFTAYEWACDLCLAGKYVGINMVDWDDDSYTNVGPGAKRGIDWIFKGGNKGGLTDLQIIFWLREHSEEFLKKYGYWDDLKLPEGFTSLNCRVIEHDLCEYQKYKKAKEGEGRPKVAFKLKTTDLSNLNLPTV